MNEFSARSNSITEWPRREFDIVIPRSATEVQTSSGILTQVCSTQYLSILWHQEFRHKLGRILQRSNPVDFGSFGSNYLGGTHPSRLKFESELALEAKAEACLCFSSGWAANYSVSFVMTRVVENICIDKRSHNSVRSGLRGSRPSVVEMDVLSESKGENCNSNSALFFSTLDGSSGTLIQPKKVCAENFDVVIQDEAHSFGMLGRGGIGDPCEGISDLRIVSFSKAFGLSGGAVLGDKEKIDAITQYSPPWMFSSSVPPINWEILHEALKVVIKLDDDRLRVMELASLFRQELCNLSVENTGDAHIVCVPLKYIDGAGEVEKLFAEEGFFVKAMIFPSVSREYPVLRFCFNPFHSESDIDRLLKAFKKIHLRLDL
jgi:8-amino-7-oxononanoate synthase